MEENYINLLSNFKLLDLDDKRDEIIKKTYELIQLLYFENKKIDSFNSALGVLKDYNDDDEYLYMDIYMKRCCEAAFSVQKDADSGFFLCKKLSRPSHYRWTVF